MDTLNYRREHSSFPHQSTADQWFSETQFECYRRLGLEAVRKILGITKEGTWTPMDWNMPELVNAAQSYLAEIAPRKEPLIL